MGSHYLAKTPKQFVNDQKASGALNRGPHIKYLTITIFAVGIDGKVLLLKHEGTEDWYLPSTTLSPEDQSYNTASILSLVFDTLKPALEHNNFKDSFQAMDFAFEEPVTHEPKYGCNLAVIATASSIPPDLCDELKGANGHETMTLSDAEEHMKQEGLIFRLDADFFSRVARRLRMYCKQNPALDVQQRKTLLLNQISVLLVTKEIAHGLKEDHDVLILRDMQGESAVLLLMQVPQEECTSYVDSDVLNFAHEYRRAIWVGRVFMQNSVSAGGLIWRMMQMTEDWLAESSFANDGRLLATWTDWNDRPVSMQQGQRGVMVESKLINWLDKTI